MVKTVERRMITAQKFRDDLYVVFMGKEPIGFIAHWGDIPLLRATEFYLNVFVCVNANNDTYRQYIHTARIIDCEPATEAVSILTGWLEDKIQVCDI